MLAQQKLRIIVTGGAGFIGCNFVRHLLRETDARVYNFDALTYAGNLASLSDVSEDPNYHFVEIDISDASAVDEAFKSIQPHAVVHLAAESHVDRSIDAPANFISTNIVGTFNLLQAARCRYMSLDGVSRESFRFLHVSTDEVYGSLGDEGSFTEKTAYDPHSPYSASKASSDHLARAWFDTFGLPVLVTNCSNNYGPYQFPEKLLPVVILKAISGAPIPVYGKGENIRDWLFVEDHCRALATVLDKGKPGETYNIGGNNELRNIDLVKQLCEILDELRPKPESYSSLIKYVADRPGHDLRYAIDASKIKNELGWQPIMSPASGLHETVLWYLENEEWWQSILDGSYRLARQGLSRAGETL
ncbi:dTDP-D-glucose-4,6-dehydratase [Rhodopirellula baltica SH28]|uniref:dTDP-glucose 4,6-dehydratase n=1 Tax=Rhodopirellula baltica SH28 TaxID=993517 RepID=K5DAK3_RHOBT|nr:dTDP-glucose 4,6-dehydratase [Rhodopirellula baltica]EKJ99828.1 dTDP-D-glucose-4,6-dehydratase [Rhodopirellula baltica SH28]